MHKIPSYFNRPPELVVPRREQSLAMAALAHVAVLVGCVGFMWALAVAIPAMQRSTVTVCYNGACHTWSGDGSK